LYQVPKAQVQVPEPQVRVQLAQSYKITMVTSTSTHNSPSSTTQVLEHGQWMVTTGTQIGRLIELYTTETAKILWSDDDDKVAENWPVCY